MTKEQLDKGKVLLRQISETENRLNELRAFKGSINLKENGYSFYIGNTPHIIWVEPSQISSMIHDEILTKETALAMLKYDFKNL